MSHPCHKDQLANLNRIEGQIRGIANMLDDDKYCIDILNQIKAVKNAIKYPMLSFNRFLLIPNIA